MKKSLSALFIALAAMALLASNVLAAPAQTNKNVSLKSVTYQRSGIVLLFSASGLSNNDLDHISFIAHSEQWNIACSFVDDEANVRCVVSKKLSIFAGEGFSGTLAGFYFAGKLPNAREFPSRAATITSTTCSAGQTLWYTFEYSNSSYQAEIWSDYYIDSDTFQILYNVTPESTNTYTESYWSNGIYYTKTYYIYNYTTYTSGFGTTPASNWDALASAYQSDGYTVQNTGTSCN
ncbi:MAG: hypothetical protein ABI986_07980 [Chloroflexota bacterium]